MDNYGLALKILRKRFSVTQTALAEKIGVSNHAISKWENGVNQPDVTTIRAICNVFNVTVDQFFRLASGESEESVFTDDKNNEKLADESKPLKSINLKSVVIALSVLCGLLLILGIVLAVNNCANNSGENESVTMPSIGESVELGEEINGSSTEFLSSINSAITLKNGISEYDYVGKLKCGDQTVQSISIKLVVDKKSGAIARFFVDSPSENVNAYTDNNFIYTVQHGEKIRLEKTAYDLEKYLEDLEEPYSQSDISQIKAYKKGYAKQYVLTFKESYAKEELKDVLEELNGAVLTDCESIVVIADGGVAEKMTVKFTYQGNEYEFIASRQLNPNSSFVFPNFSEYKKAEVVADVLSEIKTYQDDTNNLKSYKKTVFENDAKKFSYCVQDETKVAKFEKSYTTPLYYANGNIYDYSSNYEGSFAYFKKLSYEDFYKKVSEKCQMKGLFELNFSLLETHVLTAIKDEDNGVTTYTVYLTQSGIEYLKNELNAYLYVYGTVYISYTVEAGVFVSVKIVDDDNKTYSMQIETPPSLDLPDLSAYRLIIDGTNVITDVKHSVVSSYVFDRETIVNPLNGEIFTMNPNKSKQILRYDKNHNVIKTYDVVLNAWNMGTLVGLNQAYLYFTAFDGYDKDITEANRLYSLNLTSGEQYCLEENYSRSKLTVAVDGYTEIKLTYNGTSGNRINLDVDFDNGVSFLYYDLKNRLVVLRDIVDGEWNVGVYDFKTSSFRKQVGFVSEEHVAGEGYYDKDTGEFISFESIGKGKQPVNYLKVVDRHPDRDYESEISADWQIVKETGKYVFTTYGVYEKVTGNFIYFPQKAEYRFFDGGVHAWEYEVDVLESEKNLYTFYF